MYKQIVRITTDSEFSLIFCSYENENHCDGSIQNEQRSLSLEIARIICKVFICILMSKIMNYEPRDSSWSHWSHGHVIIRSAWAHAAENRSGTVSLFLEIRIWPQKVNSRNCIHQLQNNESSHFYCSTFVWLASMLNLSAFTVIVTTDTGSPTNYVLVCHAVI